MKMLQQVANNYGYNSIDHMLDMAASHSVVLGICECGYTTTVGPDETGWCKKCEDQSCTSVLLLGEMA